MFSERRILCLMTVLVTVCCSPYRRLERIRSGEVSMSISVPDEKEIEEVDTEVIVDSIRSTLADEPFIMNAIKDTDTGEMVATDVINASTVVARFRNVAERFGYVSIGFDVRVPEQMSDSKWQLKLRPEMTMAGEVYKLDPIFITGEGYRESQLRGYERYRRFLATIVEDSTDFIRQGQLEIFLQRHFPMTYAMKNDSTFISEPEAENLFGATQEEALRHYTMQLRKKMNDRKRARKDDVFLRLVKDPIVEEGIRLDTVLNTSDGEFLYKYTHTFKSRPNLKKVIVKLAGSLYEDGKVIAELPVPDDLTFYISSLSSLVDDTPRYRMIVLERRAYDNTKAFLDFEKGSAVVDTAVGNNADELRRILKCISDVASRSEFALDSLLIVASCSPEGAWSRNKILSSKRSEAVKKYLVDYVPEEWKDSMRTAAIPENWTQMSKLVAHDTILLPGERRRILKVIEEMNDPDVAEKKLSEMPQYRYLREKVYPKLRSVSFDFYLHRIGMVKDTVHTMEIDTIYQQGVEALRNLDYKSAVALLRPYKDYNSALAYMSADYNHSALDVLNTLDDTQSRVCYLKAIIMSRLGLKDEALKYFELGVAYDPSLEHRANLDPELFDIIKLRNSKLKYYDEEFY